MGGRGNFLITASSKDKTFCHLLYSLQKQKPPVIYYTAFKNKNHLSKHQNHQNLLSFIIQPSKTKTTCQNHQNLLSKPAVKTSKPSKPPVKIIKTCCQNIKTIKTTCQKHQNLLSITSKPSKPPVKTSNLLSIT